MFLILSYDLMNFFTFIFLQYIFIKKFSLFNRFLFQDDPLLYTFHSFEYMMIIKYIIDLQISYYLALLLVLFLFGFNYIFIICFLQEILLFYKIKRIFYINYL